MRYEELSVGELTVDKILGAGAPEPPIRGDRWFMDPKWGSNGNSGKTQGEAFETLAAAEAAMAADQDDTLNWLGGDTVTSLSAQLLWDKDYTHIRGRCSPTRMNHACQIDHTSAETDGVVQFTAVGATFANFTLNHTGANTIIVNALIDGSDLAFYNVHFKNGNSSALKAVATPKFVTLSGAENIYMERCTFGNLTIERTDGAAEMWIGPDTCKGLEFVDCLWIIGLATQTDHVMIEIQDDADIDDILLLTRPTFVCLNATQTVAIAQATGALTGRVIIRDPMLVNITDIVDEEEEVYVVGPSMEAAVAAAAPGKTIGIAINPNAG